MVTWMDRRHKDPNPMRNAMAYKGNHTIFPLDMLSFIDNNPVPLVPTEYAHAKAQLDAAVLLQQTPKFLSIRHRYPSGESQGSRSGVERRYWANCSSAAFRPGSHGSGHHERRIMSW
jgi:hypothetical protein